MPIQHGQKWYCQLLLDKNRYKLAERLAEKEGKKVTALMRDMVYAALEEAVSGTEYKAAEAADRAAWAESIRRRVRGRMKNKQADSQRAPGQDSVQDA